MAASRNWDVVSDGEMVREREDGWVGGHTKMRIIHVSTVCSDSGSNESRPIVISWSARRRGSKQERLS